MSWLGSIFKRRRPMTAEDFGTAIANLLLDADDCWADVCQLRSYDAPGPIATCEMAFARMGQLKADVWRRFDRPIAERIREGVNRAVQASFADQDTRETRTHYGRAMKEVAPLRVSFYNNAAMMTGDVSAELGDELSVPGPWSIEIGPMFQRIDQRMDAALSLVQVQ